MLTLPGVVSCEPPVIIPGARWRSAGSQLDIPLDVHVTATLPGLLEVHQENDLAPSQYYECALKGGSEANWRGCRKIAGKLKSYIVKSQSIPNQSFQPLA
ncbi:hypothetical protein K438DRAFT_1805021 [Mycena galopus ATCC 62051]|nr:hypothetical protein K438DRAFT_1805021 [Mycena galopus ATCC 62051]